MFQSSVQSSLFSCTSVHYVRCLESQALDAIPACTEKENENPLFACCLLVGNKNVFFFI